MTHNGLSKCALFDQIVWRAVSWRISDLLLVIFSNSCCCQAVLDGSYRFYLWRCYVNISCSHYSAVPTSAVMSFCSVTRKMFLNYAAVCVGALMCDPYEVLALLNLSRCRPACPVSLIGWLDGAHGGIQEWSHGHSAGADRGGGRPQPAE
jgi:hypothetical protein